MNINSTNQEQYILSQKESALWDCIKRKASRSSGYIYMFRLKDEYDEITPSVHQKSRAIAAAKKVAEIYPSIELTGADIQHLVTQNKAKVEYLKTLGYRFEINKNGVYAAFPDKEALLAKWQRLQQANPRLPTITICSIDDTADDETFITSQFDADLVLATRNKFAHDQFAHGLKTFWLIAKSDLEDGENHYQTLRQEWTSRVKETLEDLHKIKRKISTNESKLHEQEAQFFLNHFEIAKSTLAAFVDFLTNQQRYAKLKKNMRTEDIFLWITKSKKWESYLQSRYPDLDVNRTLFENLSRSFKLLKQL